MIIRKGQLQDLTELQLLFVETIKNVCKTDYNSEQLEVWTYGVKNKELWNEIMINQLVLVAQIENKIVGFISLDKGNYIDLLYVHKDYQGQGIARKLYTNIENIAIQQGQTELKSDVSKTAKLFFEKAGFELINEQIVMRQGVELANFKMTKNISITISPNHNIGLATSGAEELY
jgi:putative acetyltransferase